MMQDDTTAVTNYSRWKASTENVEMASGSKSSAVKSLSWKRWLIILIVSVLVALVLGIIIGYLIRRASVPTKQSNDTDKQDQTTTQKPKNSGYSAEMYEELSKNIDVGTIQQYIRFVTSVPMTYWNNPSISLLKSLKGMKRDAVDERKSFPPGTEDAHGLPDELANGHCKSLGVWPVSLDVFQGLISRPDGVNGIYEVSNGYKYQTDGSAGETMKPFVAYTQPGNATGYPVFTGYGRKQDFFSVVNYTSAICYMKYGKINVYHKIVNAQAAGCLGVVLYPDSKDFPHIKANNTIIANAKLMNGDPLSPGTPNIAPGYQLSIEEATNLYLPPNITVISASQEMVKQALDKLPNASSVTKPDEWDSTIPEVSNGVDVDMNTMISITVSNTLSNANVSRGVCAVRGSFDTDKFIFVGTHHDTAGSGAVDPATGQAIMREMIRLLATYSDIYTPTRSVVFMSDDATYQNLLTEEWLEANNKEFEDRVVAYVALTGPLGQGNTLNVKVSLPLRSFAEELVEEEDIDYQLNSYDGVKYYKSYMSDIGAPVIEFGFTDKNESSLNSLPVCCEEATPNLDPERVEKMARLYLKAVMRLAGGRFVPYNITEISDQVMKGLPLVQSSGADPKLISAFTIEAMKVRKMITQLDEKIRAVLPHVDRIKDVGVRRINFALNGLSRAFMHLEGVPMLDPRDSTIIMRNFNNRNMLIGTTSYNDYEIVTFPGLVELLSAPDRTENIQREISKHITEIMIALTVAQDYSIRALVDSDVFTPQ